MITPVSSPIDHPETEKPPFFMVRRDTEVIHINFRFAEVDAVYFPQIEVIGEALGDNSHGDFSRLLVIHEANETQIAEGADDNLFSFYSQRLGADIRRVLPSEGIVALDNGIYKILHGAHC